MNHRFSDVAAEPEIFEFVFNFLQSVSTFSRIAHCDRIINSFLQPELRSNSLESDNLEFREIGVGIVKEEITARSRLAWGPKPPHPS